MSYFKPAFSFVLCQVVYHCERARYVCGWDFKYRWWIESPLEGSASLNSLSFFTEILLTESFFFFFLEKKSGGTRIVIVVAF